MGRRWDKEKAEKFFQDGESRVTNDELEDFDKELEEDARRESERRLKEQFDPTDESDSEVSFDVDDESFDLPNIEESTTGGIEIEEKTGYSRSTSKLSRSNLINREKRPYNNSNSENNKIEERIKYFFYCRFDLNVKLCIVKRLF